MLYKTKLERLATYNHSSLLEPFVSYEEKEVWILPQTSYLQARCHDTQHHDTKHNDIEHKHNEHEDIGHNDTEHYNK